MNDELLSYEIRWAKESDWNHTMDMVWRTFLVFEGKEYSQEGIQSFFDFITDEKLHRLFTEGKYQMVVAADGEKIIGMASVRGGNHLSLLFVDEAYHRRGIGKALMTKLFRYLQEEAGERYISLKAAPYAVNFYRRLGFQTVCPEEEYAGIRVTPMEKVF
ncbi:GNAT family N-acetyltransferase [Lachnospiraceae bacterium OttesenSCG-928-D06]|nr:GNAT family N-acetyltransferase [Lachnospiraceae bacterium OttesenSCG-928-D06]